MCEKPLPAELLFSSEQIAALKKQSDLEEKEAKEFGQQLNDLGPHDHGGIGMI
ncbi:MAG: hypothetical protein ABSE90_03080 [Verrucomicrobiota bacterium]